MRRLALLFLIACHSQEQAQHEPAPVASASASPIASVSVSVTTSPAPRASALVTIDAGKNETATRRHENAVSSILDQSPSHEFALSGAGYARDAGGPGAGGLNLGRDH